jgi:hypothetical protein
LIGRIGGAGQRGDDESNPDGQGESFHDSQSRRLFGEWLSVRHPDNAALAAALQP